jgi:hypothetical protein
LPIRCPALFQLWSKNRPFSSVLLLPVTKKNCLDVLIFKVLQNQGVPGLEIVARHVGSDAIIEGEAYFGAGVGFVGNLLFLYGTGERQEYWKQ